MNRILILSLAVLLAGCGSSTEPRDDGELELFTTGDAYATGAPIEVTLVNRTATTVMVMQCKNRMALGVEKRVNSTWTSVDDVGSGCADATETPIAPADNMSEFRVIAAQGTYRFVVYGRRAAEDFGSLRVRSNSFAVE